MLSTLVRNVRSGGDGDVAHWRGEEDLNLPAPKKTKLTSNTAGSLLRNDGLSADTMLQAIKATSDALLLSGSEFQNRYKFARFCQNYNEAQMRKFLEWDPTLPMCRLTANMGIPTDGQTPLHVAAANGTLPAIQLCLQFGHKAMLTLYVRDLQGRTPLHIAAMEGQAHIVAFLLDAMEQEQGVRPIGIYSPVDLSGQTPLGLSKQRSKGRPKSQPIIDLLFHEGDRSVLPFVPAPQRSYRSAETSGGCIAYGYSQCPGWTELMEDRTLIASPIALTQTAPSLLAGCESVVQYSFRPEPQAQTQTVTSSFYNSPKPSTNTSYSPWHIFAVFDGHGGQVCSRFLADRFCCLLYEQARCLHLVDVASCSSSSNTTTFLGISDPSPTILEDLLQRTCLLLDESLRNDPIMVVKRDQKLSNSSANATAVSTSTGTSSSSGTANPATGSVGSTAGGRLSLYDASGSTMTLALITPRYVALANVGDSRTVLAASTATAAADSSDRSVKDSMLTAVDVAEEEEEKDESKRKQSSSWWFFGNASKDQKVPISNVEEADEEEDEDQKEEDEDDNDSADDEKDERKKRSRHRSAEEHFLDDALAYYLSTLDPATSTSTSTPSAGETCCAGLSILAETRDHKAHLPEERVRALQAGARVTLVPGATSLTPLYEVYTDHYDVRLRMTRSFGDFYLKQQHALAPDAQAVIAVPDVLVIDRQRDNRCMSGNEVNKSGQSGSDSLDNHATTARNATSTASCATQTSPTNGDYHYYLCLLACDGLWDVFPSHEALSFLLFAAGHISATRDSVMVEEALALACDALVLEAMRRGSRDNISCVATLVPTAASAAVPNSTAAGATSTATSSFHSTSLATSSSTAVASSVSASQWRWPVVRSTFAPPIAAAPSLPSQSNNNSSSSSASGSVVPVRAGASTLNSVGVGGVGGVSRAVPISGNTGGHGLNHSAGTNNRAAVVSSGQGEQENRGSASNSTIRNASNSLMSPKNASDMTSGESGEGGSAKTRARKRGSL